MDDSPLWQRRFRSPILGFPTWSRHAPDRLVIASSESGRYQLQSWDLATGVRTTITDEPVGVLAGEVTPDGEWVVWHRDTSGDETGAWVAAPFHGGVPEPFLEGLPPGWSDGLAIGRRVVVAAVNDRDGFNVYASIDGGPARRLMHHPEAIALGGESGEVGGGSDIGALSADESLLAVAHAEHGDQIHEALRVLDVRTGEVRGDLRYEGIALAADAWSPIPGDQRLAIGHERNGERLPAIWDLATGQVRDLVLPEERETETCDWWPDGSALLLAQVVDGRHRLLRYDLATDAVTVLPTHEGSMTGARVRPDGTVWYRLQRGEHPGRLYAAGQDEPVLALPDAPPGRPFIPWEFKNPDGHRVQGWRLEPDGPAPWPTILHIHGGPTSIDLDRWAPDLQAYVDAGFQVLLVNYRGSLGFGAAWRDALVGNVGFPEIEDGLAGVDDALAKGLVDPSRLVLAGRSWGGYITLLGLGTRPERFRAGVAVVPVGDYVAAYADESPLLQAYDRALLGGPPEEVMDLLVERSPITYVDRVTAPVLVIAGRNDSRCPLQQVLNYTDRLAARGHPHELTLYETGHSSLDVEERIRHVALILRFLGEHIPGIAALEGVAELGAPDPA